MTLAPGVLSLVLLAALFHASWNALVKSGGDKLVMQTFVICTPGAVSLLFLPFVPLPDPASWPYLAASVGIHLIYFGFLVYAYRHGDLSQVYPIARGAAPALVAVMAWLLAGETLSAQEILGLAIVSLGIISLSRLARLLFGQDRPRDGEVKAIVFALLSATTIGSYSLADGIGVRQAGSEISYILWLLFLEAPLLLAYTLWRRRGRIAESFRPYWVRGIGGGLVAGLAYGIVIWAMSAAPLAHVVALRETSVIIAAYIGTRMMGEPFGKTRMAAAVLVAGGAILLNVAG